MGTIRQSGAKPISRGAISHSVVVTRLRLWGDGEATAQALCTTPAGLRDPGILKMKLNVLPNHDLLADFRNRANISILRPFAIYSKDANSSDLEQTVLASR